MEIEEKKSNNIIILIIGVIIIIIGIILTISFLKNKQDIYKFDFFDGYEPGNTYKGKINLTNGKVNFKVIHGCSLPNPDECPSDTIVKGTLNQENLKLVKTVLESNNHKDNNWLLTGISYLIQGDKICEKETNQTCEEIGKNLIEFSNQN